MAAADNTVKLSKKHRSNSVKVAALTALKSGVSPGQISKELEIPPSTLRQWREVSMESGDSGIARPAPRKDDEEDCEASAQDLRMLRELRNRPHLLRGEEPDYIFFYVLYVVCVTSCIPETTPRVLI